MFVKISGLGFVWAKGSYLRDYWNILDFVIVISGYVTLYLEGMAQGAASGHKKEFGEDTGFGGGADLTGLRVFRVLRPLKTIQNIRGLKVLMTAVLSAIPLLKDTVIILIFFFMLYSIMGTQLLTGELKKRCFSK